MSPEPASGSGAQAAITENWQAFFDGKTPGPQKIALLQNGPTFAQAIDAQVNSSLAQAATATVHGVSINGSTANVSYDVGITGGLGLPNQTGKAIYQDGIWKVSDASFCGLLTLEGGGKAPAVCASVK
jgi:hypothetical protein